MKLLLWCICVLVVVLGHCTGDDDISLLIRALDAFTRALNYMQENVSEINLDAIFCARKLQEQIEAYLEFQPEVFRNVRRWLEVLRDKAKQVAEEGTPYVYINEPEYAKVDGAMIKESKKIAWYPSEVTSLDHTDQSVICPNYYYDFPRMNNCYNQMSGGRGTVCDVDPECYDLNTEWYQRDYGLTHQVLYWQQMEGIGCVEEISYDRRLRFCSNVMRDAKRIADAHFPHTHMDLFMEMVGFCGFWGFKDFNKPEWLEKILELQKSSGCYSIGGNYYCFDELSNATLRRHKREEYTLKDGCMTHKTAAAVAALLVNIRFEAEKNYLRRKGSAYELNALLNGVQVSG